MIADSAVHEIDLVRWLFGEQVAAATDSCLEALRSGQRTPVTLRDRPEFYAKAL
jgi:predicted dehydrogenase